MIVIQKIVPLDSARLLMRACIYLTKNKQTEVIHENSKNFNQTKLMFWTRVRRRAPSFGEFLRS